MFILLRCPEPLHYLSIYYYNSALSSVVSSLPAWHCLSMSKEDSVGEVTSSKYSAKTLLCVFFSAVKCGNLPEIQIHTNRDGNGATYQTNVTYTCEQGYSFTPTDPQHSTTTIACTATGLFEPNQVTPCLRKFVELTASV